MSAHRHIVWGTFDTGKPRVRMLIEALSIGHPELPIIHRNPWAGIEDKSQVQGLLIKLAILLGWLAKYPALVWSYLRAPKHEIVVVPYPGNLDVLILWPFARLRGARICWDMFLSLYDTAVIDRAMLARKGLIARLLYGVEWLSTRAADRVLLDTETHARHVAHLFGLANGKVGAFHVGAEIEIFARADTPPPVKPMNVLFYGQFIPLHGLDTIVEAIALIEKRGGDLRPEFTIVGSGQEQARIDALIVSRSLRSVERIAWVPYDALPALIERSSICLGIFAPEGKATRVIPNKVYQILAVGRPLITMDSPAIRELVVPGPALSLVPPGDAPALANEIIIMLRKLTAPNGADALHASAIAGMPRVGPLIIRNQFIAATETL